MNMRHGLTQFAILFLAFGLPGIWNAAAKITGDFTGAKCIFCDQRNTLKKIDSQGNVINVFDADVTIQNIYYYQSGALYIVFSSPQIVSADGASYILARADVTNNVMTGIDSNLNLTSIIWSSADHQPSVQVDGASNIYYLATEEGKTVLKKYQDENHISNLINDNISIDTWRVTTNGTVLMGGYTLSTSAQWFRKLTSGNVLSTLISGGRPNFITEFPDERIYTGIGYTPYQGVYRLPTDLSVFSPSNMYIGNASGGGYTNASGGYTAEYDTQAACSNHDSTYCSSFLGGGYSIRSFINITNNIYATSSPAGSNPESKAIALYYPRLEIIEPSLLDEVLIVNKVNHLLVAAGTKNGVNKLILLDPVTTNEISLLSEEIEIYHLTSMGEGSVWFDGLKFNGNKYIVGKVAISINTVSGKSSVKAAYTEMATLDGKPTYLVGLSGTERLQTPTGLTASVGAYSDKIRLEWGSVSEATTYAVYRNTTNDNNGLSAIAASIATTNYEDTSAAPATLYYYWVKALNATNFSRYSEVAMGYCGATPPYLNPFYVSVDFDGDRKNDPAVYVESTGTWYVRLSGSGYETVTVSLGGASHSAIPADFDGDGKADPAVYERSTGNWLIMLSGSSYGTASLTGFGGSSYSAGAGDFDGDGKADPAICETAATRDWQIKLSGSSYATTRLTSFGDSGAAIKLADFDGDGKIDPTVYVESTGTWYIQLSASGYTEASAALGGTGHDAIPADFDGDGKADPAVYERSTGNWQVMLSGSGYGTASLTGFGGSSYGENAGDYDSDRKADPIVFDITTGFWRVKLSASGYVEATASSGYTP